MILKKTSGNIIYSIENVLNYLRHHLQLCVDLILLCAADNNALVPAIKVCNDAEIPLMTFTNAVGPNPDGKYEGLVSYIGTN